MIRIQSIAASGITAVAILVTALFMATAMDAAPAQMEDTQLPLPLPEQSPASLAEPRVEADPVAALLDKGFHDLYELHFDGARASFLAYQKAHPEDPLGKAAEAASYLFEQFHTKGILTSAFFLNDDRFLGGIEGNPSQNKNPAFLEANHAAHEVAKKAVKANPHDAHGLLVLTITDGMESNYAALIEKKQLSALSLMRQAESEASALLAVDPNAKDAYVALGMSNYVIGSLPSYKKMFLWFGGVHGDRTRGMQMMSSAAEEGRYLSPFAKVMLALAYEREKQPERARPLLESLTTEFPSNTVFASELALLDSKKVCCKH